ncbi:hypothetical protein ACRAWF_26740 [Streptomyces sp. L7]
MSTFAFVGDLGARAVEVTGRARAAAGGHPATDEAAPCGGGRDRLRTPLR